ncbi:MAG: hypothetical protein K1566_01855 [Candidatus Thiodiazotropha sp. (ex. Lucinisca nassula)]|nr:hypothetical protein [Candidatus Thiodiazotropha sp. (ex. Lucinisca nassula)]
MRTNDISWCCSVVTRLMAESVWRQAKGGQVCLEAGKRDRCLGLACCASL